MSLCIRYSVWPWNFILVHLFKSEGEHEGWANSWFWQKVDVAFELIDDQFRDHESESNTIGVHLLIVINEPKKLKELILVFLCNSNTCIDNRYLDELIFTLFNDFDFNMDMAVLSELQRIGL